MKSQCFNFNSESLWRIAPTIIYQIWPQCFNYHTKNILKSYIVTTSWFLQMMTLIMYTSNNISLFLSHCSNWNTLIFFFVFNSVHLRHRVCLYSIMCVFHYKPSQFAIKALSSKSAFIRVMLYLVLYHSYTQCIRTDPKK